MASYYEAIREFRELTQQRERATLDARGEQRLEMLAAWIDAGATTVPPEPVPEPSEPLLLSSGTDRFAASSDDPPEDAPSEESEELPVREPTLRMLRDAPAPPEEEPVQVEVSAGPRSNEWLASPADSRPHLVSSPGEGPSGEAGGDVLVQSAPSLDPTGLVAAPGVAPAISHPEWFADVQWDDRPPEQPLVISAEAQWQPPQEISAPALLPQVEEEFPSGQQESSWDPPAATAAPPQESGWDLPAEDGPPILVPAAPEHDPLDENPGVLAAPSPRELTADLPEAEAILLEAAEENLPPAKSGGWPPSPGEWPPIRLVPLPESAESSALDLPAGGTPPPMTAWSQPAIPIYRPGAGGTPLLSPMPPVPSPAPATAAPVLHGEHRVALHTIEGQVKRGVATDIDLGADGVLLAASGGAAERIPFARAKALFFLLQPGEKPPASSGKRVQVTFADGRKVEGHLEDDIGPGFFLVPADARTNTARMYVLHHAVRSVTP